MSEICPVFINNNCLIKTTFNTNFISKNLNLKIYSDQNCDGNICNCSFKEISSNSIVSEQIEKSDVKDEQNYNTKVSIHLYENPYLIKSDVLVYPSNNVLTIDDDNLNRMSKGMVQSELDNFKKPIKMGTVYITSNGGESSRVQSKKIFHATVAGESRLVNEADMKSSIRKSLHISNQTNVRNVVMLPPDCGTHDISDTARVHLSSIKTFLQSEKKCSIKNIFIVMSDKESFDVYEEYYKRIFK